MESMERIPLTATSFLPIVRRLCLSFGEPSHAKKDHFVTVRDFHFPGGSRGDRFGPFDYHEPGFYRRAELPEGPRRVQLSNECTGKFIKLGGYLKEGCGNAQEEWTVEITEEQLNSFFQEGFKKWPDCANLEKQGISDPRIVFDKDRIRLAFRYGTRPWSTILSFDVRVWLASKEANVLVMEFLGRHAGALPISAQSILESISDHLRGRNNLEVTMYRHEGNPTAVVRFECDKSRSAFQLRRIELEDGKITIGGLTRDTDQQAMLSRPR